MSSHSSLFYSESYSQLLSELEESRDSSIQEVHNLTIVKFLARGDSLVPSLLQLVEQIRHDFPSDSWPSHSSWNLINYHLSVAYFHAGRLSDCISLLNSLWEHFEILDKLIALFVALLTVEVAVRMKYTDSVNRAISFLQMNFPGPAAVSSFLNSKIADEKFIGKVAEEIQFAELRIKVATAVYSQTESAKPLLTGVIGAVEISTDSKTRILFPVSQATALARAAFHIDDHTHYVPILESAENQAHFAILNNRGIFDLLQKRYSSALLHFSKALEARKNTAIIHPFQQIIYNIGLSLLLRKQPEKAFPFFHSIIPVMTESPYLWLRLAECCVLFYKKKVDLFRKEHQVSPVVARRLSTPTRTFIVLPQSDYRVFERDPINGDLNLEFADRAAKNSITLCGDVIELEPVRKSAELLAAFVALELGDGKRAVEMGAAVSAWSSIDSQRSFLAKIYAAQGHSIAGDSQEAARILARLMMEASRDLKEKDVLAVHQLTFARVALAGQDLKKAGFQLKNADTRPEGVLMKVAIELKQRSIQSAIDAINGFSHG
jgi:CCR4-NOT transcription complex subunit 10